MADALAFRGVSAGYGETVVLEDVNLALAQGENVSIIGRNGVGKTTLLATAMGHTRLHKGDVLLGGTSIARMPIYARALAGLGYVPQEREIFPSLSVRENLEIGARPGYWTEARIFELFPRLSERLTNMGNQLSGGEQQMLSIARALLTNPDRAADGRADRRARAGAGRDAHRRAHEAARLRPFHCAGRAEQPRGARLLRARRHHGQGPHRL